MTVAALIFDLDGTLVDNMPAHYIAWQNVLKPHGIVFTEERFYGLGGWPTKKIIELLSREQGIEVDAEQLSREKDDLKEDFFNTIAPQEKVVAIAREQRGKMPMAVATGSRRPIALRMMEQLEITTWFDAIVTAEDTLLHKPDPAVFLEAAKRLGVEPTSCRVYEDTDPGIEAAKRAGMEWVDIRRL